MIEFWIQLAYLEQCDKSQKMALESARENDSIANFRNHNVLIQAPDRELTGFMVRYITLSRRGIKNLEILNFEIDFSKIVLKLRWWASKISKSTALKIPFIQMYEDLRRSRR